ncbi:hypothetical protein Ctob_009268 [Chrysochromulina tobinii]|uniref:Uncharacterized protein n=1 Tax=Chrysochromulina tobinii TaxID=1460289 RepID=A0A0M0K2L9_9EUKA|nr:hypothetical protein Ctob_009268 [Chrysochromulina tobinii]|eukprot:KOO32847.1 hypothetical protein Ctob_009268 [Chrysochromulina sp. CCMP291]
MIEVIKSIKS